MTCSVIGGSSVLSIAATTSCCPPQLPSPSLIRMIVPFPESGVRALAAATSESASGVIPWATTLFIDERICSRRAAENGSTAYMSSISWQLST